MKCAHCGKNHLVVSELLATLGTLDPMDELSKNAVGNLIVTRVLDHAKDEYRDIGYIDLCDGTFNPCEEVGGQ